MILSFLLFYDVINNVIKINEVKKIAEEKTFFSS